MPIYRGYMTALAPAAVPAPPAPRPPLVDGAWLVGNTLEMAKDPAAFFLRCYRQYGPAFRIRVLGREQTVLAGPEAALFMGTAQGRECLRSKEFWHGLTQEYGAQRTLTGEDGQVHKEMRAILRRGYSRKAIEGRYPEVAAITAQAIDRDWVPGTDVAVVPAMQYLVVDQLGTLLTGEAPREYVEDIRLLITVILNVLVTRQRPRILLLDPRYRRAKERVNELGQAMIAERLGAPLPPEDQRTLIDDVIAANVERPDLFPDSDLVLSLTGPYVAGLDTVANTLAATVYAVLKHPEVLERVTSEADALFAGGVIDESTLTTAIPSINGAISEAMRLYPIAVAQMRTATQDFIFEGMQIKADELLYVATSVPHFMAEFFPDPERFDIDRYSKSRAEDRAPGAYSPYGRGPHLCLGKSLAEVQMALTIATLFHSRTLTLPSPGYVLKTKTAPTPGPSRRFRVKVADRAGAHL